MGEGNREVKILEDVGEDRVGRIMGEIELVVIDLEEEIMVVAETEEMEDSSQKEETGGMEEVEGEEMEGTL